MEKIEKLISAVFQDLLVLYLILLLAETIWEKSVTPYLNINHLLALVIITGIITVLTAKEEKPEPQPITKNDYIMAAAAGIAGAVIIYYKTSEIGSLSIIISIISGTLIILLSILVLQEDEEDDTRNTKDNTGNRICTVPARLPMVIRIFQKRRDRHNRKDSPVIRSFNSDSSPRRILPELAVSDKNRSHKLHNNNTHNISNRLLSLKNRFKKVSQKNKEPKNINAREIKAAFDYEFKFKPKNIPPAIEEKQTDRRLKEIKKRLMDHDKTKDR